MVRKKMFGMILTVMIGLFILTTAVQAEETEHVFDSFLEVIEHYEKTCGNPYTVQYGDKYMLKGLCYVKPVDFDYDGNPELAVTYNTSASNDMYQYSMGFCTDIWGKTEPYNENDSKIEKCASLPVQHSNGAWPSIGFLNLDGTLVYKEESGFEGRYYGMVNGNLDVLTSWECEASGAYYKVNGIDVSWGEFVSQRDKQNAAPSWDFLLYADNSETLIRSAEGQIELAREAARLIDEGRPEMNIDDFTGYYFLNGRHNLKTETFGANLEVMELSFNDDGNLVKFKGLLRNSSGAAYYRDYSKFTVKDNVLAGSCFRIRTANGTLREELNEYDYLIALGEGVILDGLDLYFKDAGEMETDAAEKAKEAPVRTGEPRTLPKVLDLDFHDGDFSSSNSFLGVPELKRKSIQKIRFKDSLSDAPNKTWDVSAALDGTVSAWMEKDEKDGSEWLVIAAEGGVIANENSSSLFRGCSRLTEVDFNHAFDTSLTKDLGYLFHKCKSLQRIDGLTDLHTESALTMKNMFFGCKKLKSLDLNGINVSRVSDMSHMFEECSGLTSLSLEQLNFMVSGNYKDMYAGTIWENSSPLLKSRSYTTLKAHFILNTSSLGETYPSLRTHIAQAYDDAIYERYKVSDWDENKELMYTLLDLNEDDVPELIIKFLNKDSGTNYKAYTYKAEICKCSEVEGAWIMLNKDKIAYFEEDHTLGYYEEDKNIYHYLQYSEGKLIEKGTESASGRYFDSGKDLHFIYAIPERIKSFEGDIDQDGSEEVVDIYGAKDLHGYDFTAVYIDDILAFSKELEGITREVNIKLGTWKDHTSLLELTFINSYSALLLGLDGQYEELISMDQLLDVDKHGSWTGSGIAHVDYDSDDTIRIEWNLNSATLGQMCFTLAYTYENYELKLMGCVPDLSSYEGVSRQLAKNLEVYRTPGSRTVSGTIPAGKEILIRDLWICDRKIWMMVSGENGISGWIPMGKDSIFMDSAFTPDYKEEDLSVNNTDSWFFDDMEMPLNEDLERYADEAMERGNDREALIYLDLMNPVIGNDKKITENRKQGKARVCEEIFANVQAYADAGQYDQVYKELMLNKVYAEKDDRFQTFMDACLENGYPQSEPVADFGAAVLPDESGREEALKAVLADVTNDYKVYEHVMWSEIDLDQDGSKEVMICSWNHPIFPSDSREYDIYRFDSQTQTFNRLPNAHLGTMPIEHGMFYWEEMGYLVIDSSYAEDSFLCYELKGDAFELAEETSADLRYLPEVSFEELGMPDGPVYEEETEMTGLSQEEKIQKIRDWFYWTEDHISSFEHYEKNLRQFAVDKENGLKRILQRSSFFFDSQYPGAQKLQADYYFHNGMLYFVYLHGDGEEHRFYLENRPDGIFCIRYIDPQGNLTDYLQGVSVEETGAYPYKLCLYGLVMKRF